MASAVWQPPWLDHPEDMADFESGAPHAKFTIETDNHGVYYGLYLERDPDRAATSVGADHGSDFADDDVAALPR